MQRTQYSIRLALTIKYRYQFPGDHTGGGPPVPIPNTVVKPARADDTGALGLGKIGRCQDYSLKPPQYCGGFFKCNAFDIALQVDFINTGLYYSIIQA